MEKTVPLVEPVVEHGAAAKHTWRATRRYDVVDDDLNEINASAISALTGPMVAA